MIAAVSASVPYVRDPSGLTVRVQLDSASVAMIASMYFDFIILFSENCLENVPCDNEREKRCD